MLPDHISFNSDPRELIASFTNGKKWSQVGVLVDENTEKHCYPLVKEVLPAHTIIQVQGGEEYKNLAQCEIIWQKLTDLGFDRHSVVFILGGGVLGDMGGFCAATFKRGIGFVLIPTTLLAQTDASIGGKLGIDFRDFKNHIGVFQEPTATLISTRFLTTLPLRELRSGFAEIVKHAIISDRELWEKISKRELNDQTWEQLIRHSVAFKYGVISSDPREKGLRKILNFGHTVGHAIEAYFLASGDRIFHGEAVAMGMIAESYIAAGKGLLSNPERDSVVAYTRKIFGPFREVANQKEVLDRMKQDKKNDGSRILMALPEGIGKAVWDIDVSEKEIVESLDFLQKK